MFAGTTHRGAALMPYFAVLIQSEGTITFILYVCLFKTFRDGFNHLICHIGGALKSRRNSAIASFKRMSLSTGSTGTH